MKKKAATATTRHKCPDCARTFERPASLGAHRARAHGYRAPQPAPMPIRAQQPEPTLADDLHDRLLAAVFPDGIPPRTEALAGVSAWLDEADRLTAR